jgi:hypothetical protein
MFSISADDDADEAEETVECNGLAVFSWVFLLAGANSMSSLVVVSSEDDDEDEEDEDEEDVAPDDMFEYRDTKSVSVLVDNGWLTLFSLRSSSLEDCIGSSLVVLLLFVLDVLSSELVCSLVLFNTR